MSATTTTFSSTGTLNASNVLRLVPEVDTHLASSHRAHDQHNDLEGYDEEQIRLMDEVCIVLDEDDQPIGSASKKVCKLEVPGIQNIAPMAYTFLHRSLDGEYREGTPTSCILSISIRFSKQTTHTTESY